MMKKGGQKMNEEKEELPTITLDDDDWKLLQVGSIMCDVSDNPPLKVKIEYVKEEEKQIWEKKVEQIAMILLVCAFVAVIFFALKVQMDYNSLLIKYNDVVQSSQNCFRLVGK